MARDVIINGNEYHGVPGVRMPTPSGGFVDFPDTSEATATAADLAEGKTAYGNSGKIVGTAKMGSWTLLGQTDLTVSTTSTSAASAGQLTLQGAWTKAKIIYVRVRDKAGKRAGYFLGSDTFFINYQLANGGTSALTYAGRIIHRYSTSSQYGQYVGATTTGYGVYGYDISSAGRVRIYHRYNSNYSLAIDGTYHVEVWALDYPDGKTPFDI